MAIKYAEGRKAWGECERCGLRYFLKELQTDGHKPNLLVCDPCWDEEHPQENLPEVVDPITLYEPTGDLDRAANPIEEAPPLFPSTDTEALVTIYRNETFGASEVFVVLVSADGEMQSTAQIVGASNPQTPSDTAKAGSLFLVGTANELYKSSDGGQSFEIVDTSSLPGNWGAFVGVASKSESEWLLADPFARMAYTADGGQTFAPVDETSEGSSANRMTYVPAVDSFVIPNQFSLVSTPDNGVTRNSIAIWSATTRFEVADNGVDTLLIATTREDIDLGGEKGVRRLVYSSAADLADATKVEGNVGGNGLAAQSIAYGNGIFAAAQSSGELGYTSDNGDTWTIVDVATQLPEGWGPVFDIQAIRYMPSGKWIIAGKIRQTSFPFEYDDYYAVSDDLQNWTFKLIGNWRSTVSGRSYSIAS